MKGTCDISREQFRLIERHISHNDMYNRNNRVVTIVIHPSLSDPGTRRVQLHRAHADSIDFGVKRDGTGIPSYRAA